MNKEQMKERVKYLNMELAHSHYHDGWVIAGFKKELSELKKKLDSYSKK